MSGALVGANPDELDALGELFARSGDELLAIHTDVQRLVRQSPWEGRDAEQFEAFWRQRSRATFDSANELLGRAAQALHRNAADQRRTSAADGGAWSVPCAPGGAGGAGGDPGDPADQVGRTEADQLAWWNSLTPEQQAQLLADEPGALLNLKGLPDDVREAASRAVVKGLLPTIATQSDALALEVGGNIKIVSLGAKGEATIKTFADGHVEVSLGGELAVGVGPKGTEDLRAEIKATGTATATWEFATQEEAQKFLKGLVEAPIPDDTGDWLKGIGSVVTGGGTTAYAGSEIAEYLQGQSDHYKTTVVGGELSGDVKLGFPGIGDVEVHEGIGVEYDTDTKETTAYIDVKAAGSATLAPWAGAASGEDKLAVTWAEDGSIKTMTLSGTYSAQTGAGFSGPAELSSVAGAGGNFEVQLNLADPANQALALDLLHGTVTGDTAQMATAYNGLVDSSQVIVQTNTVSTTKVGVDAVVVSAGGSGTSTTNVDTFVKPSHGDFVQVKP